MMRGREFCMKDAYSFCATTEDAKTIYQQIYKSYLSIFHKIGVFAIPVQANTGAIGGDMSHEFQIISNSGESSIFYDAKLDKLLDRANSGDVTDENIDEMLSLYAASDEMHDPTKTTNIELKNVKVLRLDIYLI